MYNSGADKVESDIWSRDAGTASNAGAFDRTYGTGESKMCIRDRYIGVTAGVLQRRQ